MLYTEKIKKVVTVLTYKRYGNLKYETENLREGSEVTKTNANAETNNK